MLTHQYVIRLCVAAGILTLIGWAILTSGREGLSQLYAESGLREGDESAVNKAIDVDPSNPGAYESRGVLKLNTGRPAEAVSDFKSAIKLRPRDYLLWLRLGYAQYKSGALGEAEKAYETAVRLAPHYGYPHRYLGRLLLKTGRRNEAFSALRQAAALDPEMLTEVIHLAHREFGVDAAAIQSALQPGSTPSKLNLAKFFINEGAISNAMALIRSAGEITDEERKELIALLIEGGGYREASDLWSSGGEGVPGRNASQGRINNGSFENPINLQEIGFDWRVDSKLKHVGLLLEAGGAREGESCLLLDFSGDSKPSVPVVTQLVLVEPGTRYQLSFSARTQKLVTGGLPFIVVRTAGGDRPVLAKSELLPPDSAGWLDFKVEFAAPADVGAVLIGVERQDCERKQCPILGRIWLDAFSLAQVT